MTAFQTEDDAIAATSGLTRDRLGSFTAAEVVIPLRTNTRPVRPSIDSALLRLLCEMSDDLDLDEAALGIRMPPIDHVRDARCALLDLSRALVREPDVVRARVKRLCSNRVRDGLRPRFHV